MYRRAQFIWTATQPIDAVAGFRLFLETPVRRDDGTNRWFLFRRRFEIPAPPDDASVTVTVDGRYQLFVNGVRVGRGPVRCDPLYQRTDTYDLRPQLRAGANVIALLVHVYGIDTAWYQAVHGHWQPVFGDGAVYCDGQVRCGGTVADILSDEQWRCLECAAWERDTPRVNWGLGFIEVHDARQMPVGWTLPDFDDSAWKPAREIVPFGGGPWGRLGAQVTLGPVKADPFSGRAEVPADLDLARALAVLEMDGLVPEEAARVTVNGRFAGGFIGRPLRLDVTAHVKPGRNEVRIEPFAPRVARLAVYAR